MPRLEQVRAPSASIDASERTGSRLTIRLAMTAGIVLVLFAALVARLWVLQVKEGPSFNRAAQQTTTENVPVAPQRGEIYARGGQALATNSTVEQVTVDPSVLAANPSVEPALASLLGVPFASLDGQITADEKLTGPYVPVVVQPGPAGVTPSDVTYIQQHPNIFLGTTITTGYSRKYPYGALASQIIGYLSERNVGKVTGTTGLEAEYENVLHGRPGSQTIFVGADTDFAGNGKFTPPVPGDAVVLNLDVPLEEKLTNALIAETAALRSGAATGQYEPAPWAAGIVMDNTGRVLAMSSVPGYDANWLVLPISNSHYDTVFPPANAHTATTPGYNLHDKGLTPPGSTFKLATATASLNHGLFPADEYVDDTGKFVYGTQTYTDSDGEVLGYVDMTSAITQSSDYYFYNLGKLFWEQNPKATPIQNTARSYGLTRPSGIDLANEEVWGSSTLPRCGIQQHNADPVDFPYGTYFGGDNVDLAIGQGETEVTPLEMADAYQTFVNHGTRYAPQLANEIVGPSGAIVKKFAPKVEGHVALPASVWEPLQQGFEGATQNPRGTAYAAFRGFNFSAWNVAGKTGTADISNDNSKPPTSWFIGFGGPSGSSKQYIVAICIYEAGFGAQASAPVARTMFDYLASHGVQKVKAP